VNDGDDSQMEAMEAVAAKDSRIRIVRLEKNSGVAAARNAGTDAAKTDWVTYPDPDDRFGSNYVQSLYEAADGTGVDLVCGGHTTIIVKKKEEQQHYIQIDSSSKVMDMASAYELLFQSITSTTSWNKLYSIPLMLENHLHQDESFPICQDHAFNLVYFMYVKRVKLIKDCGYIYYDYPYGSKSTSNNHLHLGVKIRIVNLLDHFYQHIGWTEQRIVSARQGYLVGVSVKLLKTLYNGKSGLTISEKAKLIQMEVMDNKEVVNSILQFDFGYDRLGRMLQLLVRIGSSWIIAFSLSFFYSVKRCFYTIRERLQ